MRKITAEMSNRFLWNLREQQVELHSLCLYQDGEMLLKKAYAPFSEGSLHPVYSVSKSFLSVLIGWLVEEGKLKLSDAWLSYFPEYRRYVRDPVFETVTVRDLLTMTLGQEREAPVQGGDDWIRKIVEEPVTVKPGTRFFYNSQASFLLGVLTERASGKRYTEYLEEKILKPLGIQEYKCETNQDEQVIAGLCLHLRTEDIAKFGIALLEEGRYGGRQVVPEAWTAEVGKMQIDNSDVIPPENVEGCRGYGYHFWLCSQGGYRCSGLFGQLCYIWPEQKLVLTAASAASGNGAILSCFYDAIREASLEAPEYTDFQIAPAAGKKSCPAGIPVKEIYSAKKNDYGIEFLEFEMEEGDETRYRISLWRRGKRFSFEAVWGRWLSQEDHFTPFTPYIYDGAMNPAYHERFAAPRLFASCAWRDGDTLAVRLRAEDYSGTPEFAFRFLEEHTVEMDYRIGAYFTEENALQAKFTATKYLHRIAGA